MKAFEVVGGDVKVGIPIEKNRIRVGRGKWVRVEDSVPRQNGRILEASVGRNALIAPKKNEEEAILVFWDIPSVPRAISCIKPNGEVKILSLGMAGNVISGQRRVALFVMKEGQRIRGTEGGPYNRLLHFANGKLSVHHA